MIWTSIFWNFISEARYKPKYLGFKPIKSDYQEILDQGKTLYYKNLNEQDYWEQVARYEEPFNAIFEFTFAMLSGDISHQIFNPICGFNDNQPLEYHGCQLFERYGWKATDNITVPDAYFLNDTTILAIEVKFDAKTSLNQLAKYIYLMMIEEEHSGESKDIHLLYIMNKHVKEALERQLNHNPDTIHQLTPQSLLNTFKMNSSSTRKNVKIFNYLEANQNQLQKIIHKIQLHGITFQELYYQLEAYTSSSTNQTANNIIKGLMAEIVKHPLSNASNKS